MELVDKSKLKELLKDKEAVLNAQQCMMPQETYNVISNYIRAVKEVVDYIDNHCKVIVGVEWLKPTDKQIAYLETAIDVIEDRAPKMTHCIESLKELLGCVKQFKDE